MKANVAACLVVLVAGCTSSSPTPPPSTQFIPPSQAVSHVPVTLTDADRAAIEAGVRAMLSGNASFRTMVATRSADGTVTACGFVNAGAGDKPYVGTLAGGSFAMTAMGGSEAETIAVNTACSQRGIHI